MFAELPEASILIALVATAMLAASAAQATPLPAQYVANRVYVLPQTLDGKTLKLFTDTGGGLFITEPAVRRVGLTMESGAATNAGDQSTSPPKFALWPKFKPGTSIPPPQGSNNRIALLPADPDGRHPFDGDGMLGQAWFAGRIWTWDYPNRRLLLESASWKPAPGASRVALGFPAKNGNRTGNFARITIHVDDKPIDMLLDTGATTMLSDAARKALADDLPAQRATSFIVDTQFRKWHVAHPDWRVVEKAEYDKFAMIEVPQVEIGGSDVGPVWFTSRSDADFHDYMSSMMDRQVEGAIGGNALAHFVMTIDYPAAEAYFHCAQACGRVTN